MFITDPEDGKRLLSVLEQLLEEMHLYSKTVDQYVLTLTTNLEGTITSASKALCDVSGFSREELIGENHLILKHPDTPDNLYEDILASLQENGTWQGEMKNQTKDQGYFWADTNIATLHDQLGHPVGYMEVRQDITDKKKIELLTLTDELTGAFNRRYYNQVFPKEISRAKREGHYLCLLLIDADNFKSYNDTYGHSAGDNVLVKIVEVLTDTFKRSGDYVIRIGGEEFAALYQVNSVEEAEMMANRARENIFNLNIEHTGNKPFQCTTVSMGLIPLAPDKVYVEEEIFKYADEALYQAKRSGRNKVFIHGTMDDIEFF